MSTPPLVSAVVVTFHPRAEHVRNLDAIRAQVDLLIVVDNGSLSEQIADLRSASQASQFTLLENGDNRGIAAALNAGVAEARRCGATWVVLFDQDSLITPGFIATMLDEYRSLGQEKKILQMVPRYRDPLTGGERPVSRYSDGGVFLAITSGSLFAMEAFERCGLFQEELFIYCVDDDFSLRIREKGYYIGLSGQAVLVHQSGLPTSAKVLGKTLITRNYRPEVRYYYARNKLWILRRYAMRFPRLILPTLREFITIPLKIALMEDDARRKIRFFALGLRDGLLGRMGRLELAKQ